MTAPDEPPRVDVIEVRRSLADMDGLSPHATNEEKR